MCNYVALRQQYPEVEDDRTVDEQEAIDFALGAMRAMREYINLALNGDEEDADRAWLDVVENGLGFAEKQGYEEMIKIYQAEKDKVSSES